MGRPGNEASSGPYKSTVNLLHLYHHSWCIVTEACSLCFVCCRHPGSTLVKKSIRQMVEDGCDEVSHLIVALYPDSLSTSISSFAVPTLMMSGRTAIVSFPELHFFMPTQKVVWARDSTAMLVLTCVHNMLVASLFISIICIKKTDPRFNGGHRYSLPTPRLF